MAARGTHGMTRALLARAARPLRHPRAVAVLAVLAAVLTAASGWLGVQLYQRHEDDRRNQDILAAARQSALNFTSLDYRRYAQDGKNVLNGATGDFKKEFSAQSAQLTKIVAQNKSVSEGRVLDAGIVRADEHTARVLVVADSKVTNVASPGGTSRNYRLQLDLVLEGGRWLTSDVEFVG